MRCLAHICGAQRSALNHVTNESLLKRCRTVCIDKETRYRRLRWLGHIGRMHDDRLPKRLLFSIVSGQRSVGRPRLMWNDIARSDLAIVHENMWYSKCQDRAGWRSKIAAVRT